MTAMGPVGSVGSGMSGSWAGLWTEKAKVKRKATAKRIRVPEEIG